jgi:hypothetical protein
LEEVKKDHQEEKSVLF